MAKKRKTNDVPELAQGNGLGMEGTAADNRRKKSAASRIGRACDRCQVRLDLPKSTKHVQPVLTLP